MRSASFRMGYRSLISGLPVANDINIGNMEGITEGILENAPDKIDDMIKWGKDILK